MLAKVQSILQNFDTSGAAYSVMGPITSGVNGSVSGGPTGNYFRLNGTTSDTWKTNRQPDLLLFDDTLNMSGSVLHARFDYRETPWLSGGGDGLRFSLYPASMITQTSDAFLTHSLTDPLYLPIDIGSGFSGVLHFHFDTFNNYEGGQDPTLVAMEPNNNHLEVNFNGNVSRSGWLASQTVPYDINDGNWHTIDIQVVANGADGLLTVTGTAGTTNHTILQNLRVPGFVFGGDYRAGFWAHYGTAISLHDVDNVLIEATQLPPTLDPLTNLTIAEDAGTQVVNLTGITAGGGETQPLRVTATSSNTGLIPTPLVTYLTANSAGSLAFKPVANQSGTAVITVTVEDGGLDGDLSTAQDNAQFSRSFTVTVLASAMVTVGSPGNAADTTGTGAVSYGYQIGKYELTRAEYTDFLNAVAATDPNGLWIDGSNMSIERSGTDGSYSYRTSAGLEDYPIVGVNAWDAARYANWLHNGRPNGLQTAATTEDGAYTLVQNGQPATSLVRNPGARFFLPNDNEWYKAAYYDSVNNAYFTYATSSNEAPVAAPPTAEPNRANYGGAVGGATPVGSYSNSFSGFGTYDQSGNVWELTEGGNWRGGGYSDGIGGWGNQSKTAVYYVGLDYFYAHTGFRIGSVFNKAPTLDSIQDLSIDEDAPSQSVGLTGITAGSGESQPLRVTATSSNVSLIPTPTVTYSSPSSTGSVAFTPVANQSGTAVITVTVEDCGLDGDVNTTGDNATFSRSFTVTVNPVNDAPTDISLSSTSIAENAGANVTVGTLSTTDVDAGSSFIYTLVSGTGDTDNAAFNINGSTLRATSSFDYESKSSYTVRVRSTDQGGLYTEKAFTITVTNVNDAPTDINLSSATIAENAGANTTVGTLSTTDVDAGSSFIYTLVSGTGDTDNSAFNISGSTLRATGSFDFESKSSYTIRVRSTDQGGLYTEKAFTITVTNVNETPTDISLSSATIAENAGANATVGTLSTTDVDINNTFTYTLVTGTGDTDNAAFNISGSTLRATSSFDFETKASFTVRVRSTDQGGLYIEKVFIITVTNVNETPTLGVLSDQTISSSAPQQVINLTGISAGGSESQSLRLTASSSNTSVIPTPQVSYVSPNASGTLSFTPVWGAVGSAVITVTVEDAGTDNDFSKIDDNLKTTRSFTVTVVNVNNPPTLNAINSLSIYEDSAAQSVSLAGITAGSGETQPLQVTAISNDPSLIPNPSVTYASPSTTGTLTFVPLADAFGTAVLVVTVEDGGADKNLSTKADNATFSRSFSVTLKPKNDAPTLIPLANLAISEDAPEQVVNLLGITAGGGESQTLRVTASSNNTALIAAPVVNYVSPSSTGSLKFTPVPDKFGSAVITVTVEDAGLDNDLAKAADNLSVTRAFTVTVNPVNDAPTLAAIANVTIAEDAAQQTVNLTGISAGGGETQPLRVTATSSNPSLIPTPAVNYTSASTTGSLAFTPVANQAGTAVITVVVEDGGLDGNLTTLTDNATFSRAFTVTVSAVNDSPTLNALSNVSINEDAPQQTVSLTGITAGGGETQPLRVTATSSNTALIATPSVTYTTANSTGSLSFAPVANQSGSAVITVTVEDGGLDGDLNTTADNAKTSRGFTVTVNPVNDIPTLDALPNLGLATSAPQQTVGLTGITAGGGESQPLKVTATSSNTTLIPTPTVTYTSPASTGSLKFTPAAGKTGTAVITVTVEDGGLDASLKSTADNATYVRTFTVTVGTAPSGLLGASSEGNPMDSSAYLHNAFIPADVNRDNLVSAVDVLLVIGVLNAGGGRSVWDILDDRYLVDVNGDQFISSLDALLVINTLNSRPQGEGEASQARPTLNIDTLKSCFSGSVSAQIQAASGNAIATVRSETNRNMIAELPWLERGHRADQLSDIETVDAVFAADDSLDFDSNRDHLKWIVEAINQHVVKKLQRR